MSEVYTQCPKCGHKLPQPLPASAACPACGIYFFKWTQASPTHTASATDDELLIEEDEGFVAGLLRPLDEMDEVNFYARCIVLVALAVWSWFLFGYDYRDGEISMSFMHNILLPIHEAGHVLFRPFGEFLMILGGSLLQLLLPFGICVAFIVKQRDNFGAAIGLWWTSISLIDLSPYIYDALHPQLMLISGSTGAEGGPHDWIYLLSVVNQLNNAQRWGTFAHVCGGLFVLAALAWGMTILLRQRTHLSGTGGKV